MAAATLNRSGVSNETSSRGGTVPGILTSISDRSFCYSSSDELGS
jgi:hypothetical protein